MDAAAPSVYRCGELVELRRGKGQNYHYRCRVGESLRHVCYWNVRSGSPTSTASDRL